MAWAAIYISVRTGFLRPSSYDMAAVPRFAFLITFVRRWTNILPTMDENLKSRFLGLYCMVVADGIVDRRELETLYRIGREQYDLSEAEINTAIKESGTSFVLPNNLEEKIRMLYQMAEIATADEEVDETEKVIMKRYALKMGFIDDNINEIIEYLIKQAFAKRQPDEVISEIINS